MFKGYDVTRTTSATKDNVTVQCDTPYPNLLPPIPTGNGKQIHDQGSKGIQLLYFDI
jgi:hypothetical protein